MTLRIIGAGMAGLLAANMLRHRDPVVIERQPELPNNHSAVLRFSSSIVSDVLGIPFRRVNLIKDVIPWSNPVADALAYSYKCFGEYRSDRSVVLPQRMEVRERWIAPPDLIERMASRVEVRFGVDFDFLTVDGQDPEQKVVSTIPMPVLLRALGDCPVRPEFRYVSGQNIRARIAGCDAYASLLVPDPQYLFSRVSVTGDELIVEVPRQHSERGLTEEEAGDQLRSAAELIGISYYGRVSSFKLYDQTYAKIAPLPEDVRKNAIHWASTVRGVAWQLGRFSTWRPGLLLDDLVKDVRKIDGWIGSPTAGYDMDVHR